MVAARPTARSSGPPSSARPLALSRVRKESRPPPAGGPAVPPHGVGNPHPRRHGRQPGQGTPVRPSLIAVALLWTLTLAACGSQPEDPTEVAQRLGAGAQSALHRGGTATVRFDVRLISGNRY